MRELVDYLGVISLFLAVCSVLASWQKEHCRKSKRECMRHERSLLLGERI